MSIGGAADLVDNKTFPNETPPPPSAPTRAMVVRAGVPQGMGHQKAIPTDHELPFEPTPRLGYPGSGRQGGRMADTTNSSSFWRGLRDGLPFVLVAGPFAMLFGAIGTEAGLSIAQVMGFSIVVVAGAAQFTALQLMGSDAPTLIVLATSLVVNLRMAMYSAALAPHLGAAKLWQRMGLAYLNFDQTYALAQAEYDRTPDQPLARKIAYFGGVATPLLPLWYGMTLVGALVGAKVPPEYALDFAMPITFIALIAPALKTRAHLAAALTSIVVALAMAWMPSGLGLIVAAIAAMVVGAQVELWQKARAERPLA